MRLFDPRPLAAPTVLLVAALTLPALQGCATTCTSDVLKSGLSALPEGHSAQDVANLVANSCASDAELTAWLRNPGSPIAKTSPLWTSTCPAGADPALVDTDPLLASRETLYKSCELSRFNLGDRAPTSKNLALATAVTQALMDDKNVDDATARAVGGAVLGAPDFDLPSTPLLRREIVGDVVEPSKVRVTLGPKGVSVDGEHVATLEAIALAPPSRPSAHAVQALVTATADLPATGWSLAIAENTKYDVIHRVVASIGRPGNPLELAVMATRKGQDHRPHRVDLHVPATTPPVALRPGPGGGWMVYDGDVPRAPIDGCPSPGPTVCLVDRQPMKAVFAQLEGAVGIHLPDQATTADLLNWLQSTQEQQFSLDDRFAPCSDAPDGMVCIPGGATVFGDGRDAPADKPTLATLSTFYLDQDEISHEQYAQCVAQGACESVAMGKPGAPVENLSYWRASYYCAWAGKRLPSEFEFERAARPPGLPPADLAKSDKPGDAKPNCEQANHAACGGTLTLANEGPLNAWGVRNLLGNVAEFTTTLPRSAGECKDCDGWDPQGPCDGAFMCKPHSTRVIRGGSFRDSADKTTPAFRTNVRWTRPYAGVGMRCAASEPVLATFPPAWVKNQPAPPAAPTALSDAHRALMLGIAEDQIDEIPECEQAMRGHARTDCKDPTHYIYPNEDRAHITFPYIENRGGALLGVGSDQNYTYAAIARSELLFLLDYDAIVIHI
ncbi:MAG: sulfatase modifying factor 1, partial [Kiritimatiellia bacterium]